MQELLKNQVVVHSDGFVLATEGVVVGKPVDLAAINMLIGHTLRHGPTNPTSSLPPRDVFVSSQRHSPRVHHSTDGQVFQLQQPYLHH